MQRSRSTPLAAYGLGAASIAAVLLLCRLVMPLAPVDFGWRPWLLPFIVPVTLASWYGGIGPGLLTTALGGLLGTWLLSGSAHGPAGAGPFAAGAFAVGWNDALQLGFFSAAGLLIGLLSERLHAAHRRVVAREAELSAEVRERAEAQVRASELAAQLARRLEELDAMIELSPVGIAIAEDADCRRVRANRALVRLLGLRADAAAPTVLEPSGCGIQMRRDGEPLAPDAHPMRRCIATGRPVRDVELEVVRADGSTCTLLNSVQPLLAADGRVRGCISVCTDLSEVKRAERALRANESMLRTMFESSSVGIVLADPVSGRFQRVNRRFCELTGYDEEELASLRFPELVHPDERERSRGEHQRLLRGEVPEHTTERRYVRKDGRSVWVRMHCVVVRDESGRPLHEVAVVVDVSERKALEEALEQQAEQLRALDRRKDEFLATLAHELRNPLAPMRNAVELIQLAANEPDTVARARSVLDRQLGQLGRLIDDLMDLSRITRGVLQLRCEPVDLAEVVQSAVETSGPALERGAHELSVRLPEEPLVLWADPVRLVQILANLLGNAARYTERGGRIGVEAARAGDDVVLVVRDSGIGIEPAELERIFDVFTRGRDSERRAHGGLGIGLALARRLAELHGGSLTARSAGSGQGSEFVLRLPLAAGARAAGAVAAPAAARPPAARRRVLVVEDDEDAAVSLGLLLRALGHEARVARDGAGALKVAEAFRPEVVLLDLGLPDTPGLEVARQLRAMPGGGELRLVALTGHGLDADRRRTSEAGFHAHAVKPLARADLEALLAS